ncbi:MAG: type II secretion system F family protein [Actinomycetota bacterium]
MRDPVERLFKSRGIDPVAPVRPVLRTRSVERLLHRADVSAAEWAAGSASVLAGLVLVGPAIVLVGVRVGVGLGGLLIVGPLMALWRVRDRAASRIAGALPGALESVARDLRSGYGLVAAIERAGASDRPGASRFERVRQRLEAGSTLASATQALAEPGDPPAARDASVLIAVAAAGGQRVAAGLDIGAAALRQDLALRDEVRVLVAQAETSARVLIALPVAFVGIGSLVGVGGLGSLLATSAGRWCLAVGLTCNALGLVWMRRLVAAVHP